LKFKPGCFIFAAISIAIQPWNISSMDVVLNVFGATAAPVVAIVAVDYYIFRKRKFSLDDIYKTHGKYYYWNGFNPAAMIAYVIGTAVAVIFMDYGFFISLAVTPIIVDKEVTMEQAKECAVDCTLNFLRALQLHFGDLDRIKQFVKMTVFVACDHDFKLQPEVGDACTGLLKELYGEERGVPARSSIGQAALPYGFPVEIEVMVEYE